MRLASLAPSNTEILYALGSGQDIVCVTEYCDHPPDARKKEAIGSWVGINYEKLQRLRPDIVLTSSIVQDKIAGKLRSMGFRVEHYDPRTLEQAFESMLAIGSLVGRRRQARELVTALRQRLEDVRQRVAGLERPRVYCEEWHMPPTASYNWVPDLVEAAGGTPYGRSGVPSAPVSLEDLTRFDPEHIILHWCGFGARSQPWQVLKRPDWAHLTALRRKKVSVIHDSLLNRPGPRLIDGCETLAALLHPETLKEQEQPIKA
jgi:iron complex transport system substrate-binding protein